jgi:hypothetical protein
LVTWQIQICKNRREAIEGTALSLIDNSISALQNNEMKRNKITILTILVIIINAMTILSCKPSKCYEIRTFRVFIPSSEEICPDPLEVFYKFRIEKKGFKKKYPNLIGVEIERAFLVEMVGFQECIDAWFEKWTTVECTNESCVCTIPGCLGQWNCDNSAIPFGKLPSESIFPFYEINGPSIRACTTGKCIVEKPDDDYFPTAIDIH